MKRKFVSLSLRERFRFRRRKWKIVGLISMSLDLSIFEVVVAPLTSKIGLAKLFNAYN
jgi:hypothetical protein